MRQRQGVLAQGHRHQTGLAAAGEPDINEQLLKGTRVGGMNYTVHIDG